MGIQKTEIYTYTCDKCGGKLEYGDVFHGIKKHSAISWTARRTTK